MVNQKDIIRVLNELGQTEKMREIKIGFLGPYAKDEQSESGDLDIVLKADHALLLITDGYERTVKDFIRQRLGCDCDVVDYADLIHEFEFYEKLGLGDYTVKARVDREAIWHEKK